MGSSAPAALKRLRFPAIVVLHSACLSCSLEAYDKAKAAFDTSGTVNVVTTDPSTYATLLSEHRGPTTMVANESLAKEMNALFSPRVFAYDGKGKLVYAQLQEAFNDAISIAKSKLGDR